MAPKRQFSIADLLLATSLIAGSLGFSSASPSGSWTQLLWLAVALGLGSGVWVGLVHGSMRRALLAGAAGALAGAALCYLAQAVPEMGRGLLAVLSGSVGMASAAVAKRQPATRIITTPAIDCAMVIFMPGLLAWIVVFFMISAECLNGRSLVEGFVALVAAAAALFIFTCGALIFGAACGCCAWLARLAADQLGGKLNVAVCQK